MRAQKQVPGYRLEFREKGFTLIEILVATTILIIAMGSIYLSFQGGVTSWTKGNARMEVYQNGRAALDMMSREISAAFIYTVNDEFFYGQSNSLDFVAVIEPMNAITDLYTIDYSYDAGTKEILRASESSVDNNITSVSGTPNTLVSDITALGFRYYDGTIWKLTWDSRTLQTDAGKLPEAVKISIAVQDEQNREQETFSTIVYIPTSR